MLKTDATGTAARKRQRCPDVKGIRRVVAKPTAFRTDGAAVYVPAPMNLSAGIRHRRGKGDITSGSAKLN